MGEEELPFIMFRLTMTEMFWSFHDHITQGILLNALAIRPIDNGSTQSGFSFSKPSIPVIILPSLTLGSSMHLVARLASANVSGRVMPTHTRNLRLIAVGPQSGIHNVPSKNPPCRPLKAIGPPNRLCSRSPRILKNGKCTRYSMKLTFPRNFSGERERNLSSHGIRRVA